MNATTTMHSQHTQAGRNQGSNSHRDDQQHNAEDLTELVNEISTAVEHYCRNRPRVVAGVLFAFGFIVGWKAKPW
ncbi:MAG TPA: hypothetical protein DDZ51_05125 [Planctomycetaceae bacterium]|nr:hypothetical protein [Planctomycetaceae bacterium]